MSSNNFLVIGSGTAGLIYALDAAKFGKVTVLSKLNLEEGNTFYAQGGIASVIDSDDSFEDHISDTLTAGAGLCNEDVVRFVIEHGPSAIEHLISLNVRFDVKDSDSKSKSEFSLGKEGGHNNRRILHWGDSTGAEIQRALIESAIANPNITLLPNHTAIDLIVDNQSSGQSRIIGCYAYDEVNNKILSIGAKITCIATGGIGKVYKYTSNPNVATGDGIAIAYRAGAEIRNMEFIQFHPTCLYHSKANSFLITEAMRGEGAVLRRRDGTPFMENYHPQKELAPRDIVARAIDHELKSSGDDFVYLDITHHTEEFLVKRFPQIYKTLLTLGINISKDLIPVVPAAHYSCGGIHVDKNGRTTLQGLYAAGEATCTGLHGANRLASNSLLEAVVYGRSAAKDSIVEFSKTADIKELPAWDDLDTKISKELVLVSHLWDEVRLTMWNLVGIVRSNLRLELAKRRLEIISKDVNSYYWKYKIDRDLLELRNIVEVALMIVNSSIKRKESRGLHFNIDFPNTDESHLKNDTSISIPANELLN